MERISLRLPKRIVTGLKSLVDNDYYPNRSEALREGARGLINEHGRSSRPARTDGNGLAVDPEQERKRRRTRRDKYETLNPSGTLLTSSELRAELPMLVARSNADGACVKSANGGDETVTVELTYHVDGRLGVFDDGGKTDPEDIRVVQLGNVYAGIEPNDTVRDLFVKTGVPTHFPETLEDALECYAVLRAEDMPKYEEPDPEDFVSFDLSDVEDGDALETHLVGSSQQPAYQDSNGDDAGGIDE